MQLEAPPRRSLQAALRSGERGVGAVGCAAPFALAAVLAFAAVVAALAAALAFAVVLALTGMLRHIGVLAEGEHGNAGAGRGCGGGGTVVLHGLGVEASGGAAEHACNRSGEGETVEGIRLHEEYLSSVLPHPLRVGRC